MISKSLLLVNALKIIKRYVKSAQIAKKQALAEGISPNKATIALMYLTEEE